MQAVSSCAELWTHQCQSPSWLGPSRPPAGPGTAATKSQHHMAKTGGSLLPAGSWSCFRVAVVTHTARSLCEAAAEASASSVTPWQCADAMLLGGVLCWLGCIWCEVRIANCAFSAQSQRNVYCLQSTCLPTLQRRSLYIGSVLAAPRLFIQAVVPESVPQGPLLLEHGDCTPKQQYKFLKG